MNEPLVIVAKFIAKDGKTEQLHRELQKLIDPTRKESGCLFYELHQNLDNPRILTMIEKFKNRATAEFHINQPYFVNFKEKSADLIEASLIDLYRLA